MNLGARRLHSVALNLEAGQYLAGWKPEAATLFLPAISDGRVGDDVAVRIGIFGRPVRATLFGAIGQVRRVGRPTLPPGVELAIDPKSLPAARYLALAARGEQLSFRERPPRFLVERRVIVTRDGAEAVATTLNVSEAGCAVEWSGPLPMVGEVLVLKSGEGFFAASGRAVVCWNALGGPLRRAVGLRVEPEGRAARAWRAIAAQAAKSGGRSS